MKKSKQITILAIDTSCDETSVAITRDRRILSNIISSQTDLHKVWGGVVPDIARRAHQDKIDFVIDKAFRVASSNLSKTLKYEDIDAIAVTQGPGLAIALEVGLNKAVELSKKHNKPLIAVNHLEGHLLSCMAENLKGEKGFELERELLPAIGLITSGKHTEIVLVREIGKYEIVGETMDDAIGEAYDKVGRMLGLGYPAGPLISELAKKGNPDKYPFPIPMEKQKENLNFSYSGLKTAVYYFVKKAGDLSKQEIYDVAASFEKSAITHLEQKLELAIIRYNPKTILAGGGVASSAKVRKGIRKTAKKYNLSVHFPFSQKLYPDNAAMIGIAGSYKYERGEILENIDTLDRQPRMKLER